MVANCAVVRRYGEQNPAYEPAHPHPLLPSRPGGAKVDHVVRLDDEETLVSTDVVLLNQMSRQHAARGVQSGGVSGALTRSPRGLPSCMPSAHCSRQTAKVVDAGWIQGAWFTVAGPSGPRVVTGHEVDLAMDQPVIGACLVGGVVQAAGGPATVRSQLVQRTLDLTWHALREDTSQPVRWCPAPRIRMMHVLELTHWNDAPERTRADVLDLLEAAQETAALQRRRCRAEQAVLATS